jgi:peroxiredoxin
MLVSILTLSANQVWATAVGDQVPTFSLQALDGKIYTPADYQGRVLVLYFMGHN